MLDVVDVGGGVGRVIEQDFDRVRAHLDNPLHREVRQQIRHAVLVGRFVARFFVSQQQPGVARARFGGGKAPLRIQQNGACVGSQDP